MEVDLIWIGKAVSHHESRIVQTWFEDLFKRFDGPDGMMLAKADDEEFGPPMLYARLSPELARHFPGFKEVPVHQWPRRVAFLAGHAEAFEAASAR
jgi:hypothetical protein